MIKEKRRQNKVLVVEPISSSPSWFIAASTVAAPDVEKELLFIEVFFSPPNYWRVSIFMTLWPCKRCYRIQFEYRSKDLPIPSTEIFFLLCEKQLKYKMNTFVLKDLKKILCWKNNNLHCLGSIVLYYIRFNKIAKVSVSNAFAYFSILKLA